MAQSSAGPALTLDELLQQLLSIKDNETRGWSCLVVGAMGVGKSRLLNAIERFCQLNRPSVAAIKDHLAQNKDKALISVLPGTVEENVELLSRCGLNTVPSWLTPFRLLSGGEQARVLTAWQLKWQDAQLIDDFGNCLDEHSASMAALAAQRLLPPNRAVIFATQSPKLAQYLQPDYVVWVSERAAFEGSAVHTLRPFDLLKNPNPRGERRPKVSITLQEGAFDAEPESCFYEGIRGGGKRMPPGPLKGLRTSVGCDAATTYVSQCTSLEFKGVIEKQFVELPMASIDARPGGWRLGCLVGPSGSGKSVTLNRLPRLCRQPAAVWEGGSVIAALGGDLDVVRKRARAVGLTKLQWNRRYDQLSAGEQAAARFAYALRPFDDDASCVVAVDEAFSYHDPAAARLCADKLRNFLRFSTGVHTQLVLAGAAIDKDLLAVLQPDWIFDPSKPADPLRVFSGPVQYKEPAASGSGAAAPGSGGAASGSGAAASDSGAVVLPPSPAALFQRFCFNGTLRRVRHEDWRTIWQVASPHHYKSTEFPRNCTRNIFALRCDKTQALVGIDV